MRLGLIGYGAIADTLLQGLAADRATLEGLACLAKPKARERAEALIGRYPTLSRQSRVATSLDDLIASDVDLVVECAGQEALRRIAEPVLAAGIDLMPASLGAFADDDFHDRVLQAAQQSGARLHLPSGAIGGLDILSAARLAGIQDIVYISRKPPDAWRGTPAESLVDLEHLAGEAVFYEGSARAAARDYPKNANVSAAVALAGLGFDRTRVRLVADATVTNNIHEIALHSTCADVVLRVEGRASVQNPKTSLTTGYSIAHLVLNRMASQVI